MKKTLALVLAVATAFSLICSTASAAVQKIWYQGAIFPSLWDGFEVNIKKADAKNVVKDGIIGENEYEEIVVDNEKQVIVNMNIPGDPSYALSLDFKGDVFQEMALDMRKTMRVYTSWDETNGFNIAIQYHLPATSFKKTSCRNTDPCADETFLMSNVGGALIQIRNAADCSFLDDPDGEWDKAGIFGGNVVYHAIGYNTYSGYKLDCLYQAGYDSINGNPLTIDAIPSIFSYDETTETVTVEASYPLKQVIRAEDPGKIYFAPQVARGMNSTGNWNQPIAIACFGETGFYVKQESIVQQHCITGNVVDAAVGTPDAKPITDIKVEADNVSVAKGTTVKWTTSVEDGIAPEFAFNLYKDDELITSTLYDGSNTFAYKLDETGSYKVKAYAKDGDTTYCTYSEYVTVGVPLTEVSVVADTDNVQAGETITWTSTAVGGTDVKYAFYIYNGANIVATQKYSSSNTYKFTPTADGIYKVKALAMSESTQVTSVSDSVAVCTPFTGVTAVADKKAATTGETITWTSTATGGTDVKYAFYLYNGSSIIDKQLYSASNTYSYTPDEEGTYKVKALAMSGSTQLTSVTDPVTVTAE